RLSVVSVGIIFVVYVSRISLSIGQLLLLAAVVIVLFDPWAMLSTGYWLSFGAVATLLACDAWYGEDLLRRQRPGLRRRLQLLYLFVLWPAVITFLFLPLL